MINPVIANSVRFIFLVLSQVLILNNINLFGYINPQLYVLFLILYPFNTPQSFFLIVAFLLGITIDTFEDTGGINAAACVIIAYIRPAILKFSFGISYDHQTLKLSSTPYGARLGYIFVTVLVHHMVLYTLEIFSFEHIALILKKTVFSAFFTILLVLISLTLFSPKNK